MRDGNGIGSSALEHLKVTAGIARMIENIWGAAKSFRVSCLAWDLLPIKAGEIGDLDPGRKLTLFGISSKFIFINARPRLPGGRSGVAVPATKVRIPPIGAALRII
jgi:hypothetical protein